MTLFQRSVQKKVDEISTESASHDCFKVNYIKYQFLTSEYTLSTYANYCRLTSVLVESTRRPWQFDAPDYS